MVDLAIKVVEMWKIKEGKGKKLNNMDKIKQHMRMTMMNVVDQR